MASTKAIILALAVFCVVAAVAYSEPDNGVEERVDLPESAEVDAIVFGRDLLARRRRRRGRRGGDRTKKNIDKINLDNKAKSKNRDGVVANVQVHGVAKGPKKNKVNQKVNLTIANFPNQRIKKRGGL